MRMEKWNYTSTSTHSYLAQHVEVSDQFHVLVALHSAKETSLLIEWDVGTLGRG